MKTTGPRHALNRQFSNNAYEFFGCKRLFKKVHRNVFMLKNPPELCHRKYQKVDKRKNSTGNLQSHVFLKFLNQISFLKEISLTIHPPDFIRFCWFNKQTRVCTLKSRCYFSLLKVTIQNFRPEKVLFFTSKSYYLDLEKYFFTSKSHYLEFQTLNSTIFHF